MHDKSIIQTKFICIILLYNDISQNNYTHLHNDAWMDVKNLFKLIMYENYPRI